MEEHNSHEQGGVSDYLDSLPVGYRFRPVDKELILDYLMNKNRNLPLPHNRIKTVNLMDYNPKHLIDKCKAYGEKECYFFTQRVRRSQKGNRPNRDGGDGFWKATVADKPVYNGVTLVGYKKALVYYNGKPLGIKTNWLMQEYRLVEAVADHDNPSTSINDANDMRIYNKKLLEEESGQPPRFNDDSTVANEQPNPSSQELLDQSSLQHNLSKPRELSYGITNTGFNSQNHVGAGLIEPISTRPRPPSIHRRILILRPSLGIFSWFLLCPPMDNQPRTSQPSSMQLWDDLEQPKWIIEDDNGNLHQDYNIRFSEADLSCIEKIFQDYFDPILLLPPPPLSQQQYRDDEQLPATSMPSSKKFVNN
ncbi:hypothetical protein HHK36_019775 [Tetracentron sinense]|uniref:NAC domain-containing protein n=1 Tax=Tetracentron sinense TaxID=13715 RepID=A0A835DAC5_TETSI|nr:hypothetical protein HHK36_019775 [Tetracentron sinense]